MIGGLNKAARYRAILLRDKKYDGIFYFGSKTARIYCRPSCLKPHPVQKNCIFFDTTLNAELQNFQPCKHCHPGRLRNGTSVAVLSNIELGGINDKGVHGLASSLHISERHLRRIVQERTGTSPLRLNMAKRMDAAQMLVTQTKLPIIEIAFSTEFSSLRQFNDVFKHAFKTSPSGMRKTALRTPVHEIISPIILPLQLSYTALRRAPLHH
ncbi:MAG TPA: Ada metal-binding domain-containing protein [Patescibacteria group bacterium]|nr:Ada metal-binding domain-containing protein [Patescibacteria group bacterium]